MTPRSFYIVIAATEEGGIGHEGKLPWYLSDDLKNFKHITTTVSDPNKQNAIIMGNKTFKSFKHGPLPNRFNVVLTKTPLVPEERKGDIQINGYFQALNLMFCNDFNTALTCLDHENVENMKSIENVFVIGGAEIFKIAIQSPYCKGIYATEIFKTYTCDTLIPPIDTSVYGLKERGEMKHDEKSNTFYRYLEYQRKQSYVTTSHQQDLPSAGQVERQYLDIVKDIIDNGVVRGDRTGTGTISKFGISMRFNLRNNEFPLLTTKNVFFRGVAEELLWLIKGSTDSKLLADKKVHIWDDNGSRAYLDKNGLTNHREGDLGPIYGFQWRHFGAQYINCDTDYTGQGIDQLAEIIHTIKTNPNDRRILMSAWNPVDMKRMALPPCHVMSQFYVANGEFV
jgi:dihydrofolate reductase/thymidylate synthase